jgi:hypothetical protein
MKNWMSSLYIMRRNDSSYNDKNIDGENTGDIAPSYNLPW